MNASESSHKAIVGAVAVFVASLSGIIFGSEAPTEAISSVVNWLGALLLAALGGGAVYAKKNQKLLLPFLLAPALLLGGCSAKRGDVFSDENLVIFAGDAGMLGCLIAYEELSPEDRAKAAAAARGVMELLASGQPRFKDIEAALAVLLDEDRVGKRTARYVAAGLSRIRARVEQFEVLDKDHVAYRASVALVSACLVALGEV